MNRLNLKQTLMVSFILCGLTVAFAFWSAALIVPDWQFYLDWPLAQNIVGWGLAIFIGIFVFTLLYFVVDQSIDNQVKNRKIKDLEDELERIKKR